MTTRTLGRSSNDCVDVWTVEVRGLSGLLGPEVVTVVCGVSGCDFVVLPTGEHLNLDIWQEGRHTRSDEKHEAYGELLDAVVSHIGAEA